jgi:hypothetical protein
LKSCAGVTLTHAGAEFLVDVVVGDDRDLAVGQRQLHHLADQVRVALVFRVHHHGGVAQHGFRRVVATVSAPLPSASG